MKNNLLAGVHVGYQAGTEKHWTGRKTNPAMGNQYWYQAIECIDVNDINETNKPDFALIGYVCEEGVRRNFGRVGAAQGPQSLREKLAKIPIHFNAKRLADLGDIICVEQDMESCQMAFSKLISLCIAQQIFPIGMGGGHDIAYGHFMGIRDAIKHKKNNKIGIINFDAHFDLRPVEGKGNSGTPFNQIIQELKQYNETINYMAIGIQSSSNTNELFEIAAKESVAYVDHFDCSPYSLNREKLEQKLADFIAANDYIYITIDLDGFSSAYATGVSAPSPLGFSPHFVFEMLRILFASNKVISCDIAELNPLFDQDNLTANLAAKLIDFIVSIK